MAVLRPRRPTDGNPPVPASDHARPVPAGWGTWCCNGTGWGQRREGHLQCPAPPSTVSEGYQGASQLLEFLQTLITKRLISVASTLVDTKSKLETMCACAAAGSHLPSLQSGPLRCSAPLCPGLGCIPLVRDAPKAPMLQALGVSSVSFPNHLLHLLSACSHHSQSCYPSAPCLSHSLSPSPCHGEAAYHTPPQQTLPPSQSQAPHVPSSQHLPELPCAVATPL